jgi:hypothetical protein
VVSGELEKRKRKNHALILDIGLAERGLRAEFFGADLAYQESSCCASI